MQLATIINQLNLKLRRYQVVSVSELVPGAIEVVVDFAHYRYSILHTNTYSTLQFDAEGVTVSSNNYTKWLTGILNNYVRDADGNMVKPLDNENSKVPVLLGTDKVRGGHRRVCPPISLF